MCGIFHIVDCKIHVYSTDSNCFEWGAFHLDFSMKSTWISVWNSHVFHTKIQCRNSFYNLLCWKKRISNEVDIWSADISYLLASVCPWLHCYHLLLINIAVCFLFNILHCINVFNALHWAMFRHSGFAENFLYVFCKKNPQQSTVRHTLQKMWSNLQHTLFC